jgi:pimeloyl-ACP methyl ester carboxylesterase
MLPTRPPSRCSYGYQVPEREVTVHLERISCLPRAAERAAPVLFVHGAWHGAWCWSEHFLPYFARHGYASHAFDLRAHGKSEGGRRLRRTSVTDYVADLGRVVGDMNALPVLVGHSMGSLIVQKYLETHQAAAAVLLAPPPPSGGIPAILRLAARHPLAVLKANATMSPHHLISTPRLAREAFFSDDIPDGRLQAYVSCLQQESYRAVLDTIVLNRPHPKRVRDPVLVLGAEGDTFFTRKEVEATARAYRTEATSFPMAHNMMLEDGWKDVADHILRWLDGLDLTPPRRTPR